MVEQAKQAIRDPGHGSDVGGARALVTAQQAPIAQRPPVLALAQHPGELGHVGQAQVQALTGQGVHGVGGITGQGHGAFGGLGQPALGGGQLQRPGLRRAAHAQFAQHGLAAALHLGQPVARGDARIGAFDGGRPHQSHGASVVAAHGQQGHDFAVGKPLVGHATVRTLAQQPRRQGFVGVRFDQKIQTPGGARGAALAFADHRQGRAGGLLQTLNATLVGHRLRQLLFQQRHIDDPAQRIRALVAGIKPQATTGIGVHPHGADGRGAVGIAGPSAKGFQQSARSGVEGVGAHVGRAVAGRGLANQGHAQAVLRQQQGQALAHNAAAANDHVKTATSGRRLGRGVHVSILGNRVRIPP